MSGTVYGISAGPGDPSLLTLRAAWVLGEASLVVAPRSHVDAGSVALTIVAEHLTAGCERVEAVFPMSEDSAEKTAAAAEAAQLLATAARAGGTAAFVTLGDAMLYSTWIYVMRALQAEYPDVAVETVPGVTSVAACAALLGIPLAEGREPLLVWPDAIPDDIGPLLDVAPNIVAMKVGRQLPGLLSAAEKAGARVSAVQRCGMDGERAVADAADLLGEETEYFTTAVVRRREAR